MLQDTPICSNGRKKGRRREGDGEKEREREKGGKPKKQEVKGRGGACDESKWRRNGVGEQERVNGSH